MMAKLAQIGMDIYFEDYLEERQDQSRALRHGLEYGSQDITDAEILRMAGLYAREYTQGSYNDSFRKWKDEQESKVKRLELLGNSIRAMVGAHVTKTEPTYRPSTLQQVAGIALAGAGMMAAIYNPGKSQTSNQNALPQPGNTQVVDQWFNDTGDSPSSYAWGSGGGK